MRSLSYAAAASYTMLRRQLRHMLRYPVTMSIVVALPVVILLLFVYVFGGLLGPGSGWSATAGVDTSTTSRRASPCSQSRARPKALRLPSP